MYILYYIKTTRCFFLLSQRHYLKSRFSSHPHCDLFDQLTFYGAFYKKFPLDFYCKAFDIKSPKGQGVTGKDMPEMFKAGRHKEIAEYCMRDVKATSDLFVRWSKTIDPTRVSATPEEADDPGPQP